MAPSRLVRLYGVDGVGHPREFIGVLSASHDRLTALAGGLDEESLTRPSMCTSGRSHESWVTWAVALRLVSPLSRRAWPGADRPGPEANPPIWERWDGAMIRGGDGRALRRVHRRFVEAFERLSADQLDSMRITFTFVPDPARRYPPLPSGFRLGEQRCCRAGRVRRVRCLGGDSCRRCGRVADRPAPADGGFDREVHAPRDAPAEPVTILIETSEPTRRYELELGDAVELRRIER